ncbi:MAG: hypothetical protein KBD00_00905 [Candidatus Peribacteraceae bacterium]|nr:hypothetical protein [Candidatus Peribacteraceae bacterium]
MKKKNFASQIGSAALVAAIVSGAVTSASLSFAESASDTYQPKMSIDGQTRPQFRPMEQNHNLDQMKKADGTQDKFRPMNTNDTMLPPSENFKGDVKNAAGNQPTDRMQQPMKPFDVFKKLLNGKGEQTTSAPTTDGSNPSNERRMLPPLKKMPIETDMKKTEESSMPQTMTTDQKNETMQKHSDQKPTGNEQMEQSRPPMSVTSLKKMLTKLEKQKVLLAKKVALNDKRIADTEAKIEKTTKESLLKSLNAKLERYELEGEKLAERLEDIDAQIEDITLTIEEMEVMESEVTE